MSDDAARRQDSAQKLELYADEDIVTAVGMLWRDSGVQAAYERRAEYHLNDSAT